MKTAVLACALGLCAASNWGAANNVSQAFDCSMRKAAYEFGQALMHAAAPRLGAFEALYWALDLASDDCKVELPAGAASNAMRTQFSEARLLSEADDDTVFVCVRGDDEGDGSYNSPLRTLRAAVDLATSKSSKRVVLRGGTHYLAETLLLNAPHSGITIEGHAGEDAVLSGGVELQDLKWTSVEASDASSDASLNVYVADVTGVDDVPGLQIGGARLTRARYPNLPGGVEVSPGYDAMIPADAAQWTPPQFEKFGKPTFYTDEDKETLRNNTPDGWFQRYMVGVGGLCNVYDPPVSYWCSEHPSGGGAFAFRTPSGVALDASKVLPNAPYKDASTAVFFVWRPNRWANWMFETSNVVADKGMLNFTFGRGGHQGARGNDEGGDFFVENVLEELDHPGEFFYDSKSKKLYVAHNGTGPPPTQGVVVPKLRVLVNASGTQWGPVRGVTLKDLEFRSTRSTFMDAHAVPSAGDWALERTAAVFLQGTEKFTVDGCAFDRLDGNGMMVSGYNRNATIKDSDFSFIGGTAIAAWGYTNETKIDPGRPGVVNLDYPKAGVDGTDGEHPRYTSVVGNTAREVGLYEKQASFFMQAKTAASTVSGNVFFNGPRAGINMNDGFGGGDEVSRNLVFSTCRESGDHGPFNSWDREPYLTSQRTGKPSMVMQWRKIRQNFFIDNYSPQENVDNDDGSAYYKTFKNFLVYGNNGMKNDYGGHDNEHFENVYAFPQSVIGVSDTLKGHEDKFFRNKCVLTSNDVGKPQCGEPFTKMYSNEYFTKDGTVNECGHSLQDLQKKKPDHEVNSTVDKFPSDETILKWAKDAIGF
ncbi:pectin lyase fold/virulence factor [Pelagophyceae sp. CCMP2097]|nr:pectin lyase fold/virulence factor [Pelagophyceae sp. CCMP2097]